MLQRPRLPQVEREFSDTNSLLNALEAWLHPHPLFDKTP
jgi:precorrin-6A/cobalt-precorrin-6A reductase